METTRMAVADRWGLGSVYDMNPRGAVYDLFPPPEGRFAEEFPMAPYSQIDDNEIEDVEDIDLFDEILGPDTTRQLFGSAAVDAKAENKAKAKNVYQTAKSFLPQGKREVVEKIEAAAKRALTPPAPPAPPVVIHEKAKVEDQTGLYVAMGAGVLAAFGAGYYMGRQSRGF